MAIKRKYQGREQSKSREESIYKETWYGTEAEVDAYISTLEIGTEITGWGYLHSWEKKQENPQVWTVEVTYRYTSSSFTYTSEDPADDDDPQNPGTVTKSYSLSVRNIQIPLESHPSYKTIWNHYLLGLGNATLPAWYSTATNTLLSVANRKYYMWVSSISEIPLEPNENNQYWIILAQPTKPGVSVYDRACFVVTEQSRYKSSASAGNAISHNINEIGDPPHKFGISGGEWKLDEGNVAFDGKRWVATRTWTRASSWDSDLYQHH